MSDIDDIYFLTHSYPDCLHPFQINGFLVPCGNCALCRANVKKDWVLRCKLENAYSKRGVFVTLTFDDEHIFDTSYRQVQLFFKRLRKLGYKLRYFGGFERGDKTNRPHYHLLIWCDNITSEAVSNAWSNGFVQVAEITDANISYVVGYSSKKLDNFSVPPVGLDRQQRSEWRLDNKYKPCKPNRGYFRFMSQGLGFSYFRKNYKDLLDRGFVNFHGVKYRIPRSFLSKIKLESPDLFEDFKNCWINYDYLSIYDRVDRHSDADIEYMRMMLLKKRQKVRNLYAKKKMCRCDEL